MMMMMMMMRMMMRMVIVAHQFEETVSVQQVSGD